MAGEFDGLDFEAAMALCVGRAFALSRPETDFLTRISDRARPLREPDRLRLAGLVRKLRQGDMMDAPR